MKSLKSIYFFVLFFNLTHASIQEYLAEIFSVDQAKPKNFWWYTQTEDKMLNSLCDIGWKLFKSIHLKTQFKDHNNPILNNIKAIDKSIVYIKPTDNELLRFYYNDLSSIEWKQLATKNPLNQNNQQKITNIRKFLHLFSFFDPLISSEKIAQKLNLNNYIFFHDHYIKYALKIDSLGICISKDYLNYIDPSFKIITNGKEKAKDCIYDWSAINFFENKKSHRKILNDLLIQLNPEQDNSEILKTVFKNTDTCEAATLIKNAVNVFIKDRLTHIIKIQAYIKTYKAYKTKKSLDIKKRETIFKSKPYNDQMPEDMWNHIISFCSPASLADLIGTSKQLYSIITQNIPRIIKAAQVLDASIQFKPRCNKWHPWFNFDNTNRKKKYLVLKAVKIPLNKKNQNKIKTIRQFIYTIICNNFSISLNQAALQLKLDNYSLFYNTYFTYAVKALAYIGCCNRHYLKDYLKLWDKNFYITISNEFTSEKYDNNDLYKQEAEKIRQTITPTIKIEIISCTYPETNCNFLYNEMNSKDSCYKCSMKNFLILLKTKRKCFISDQFIEHFDNHTIENQEKPLILEKSESNETLAAQIIQNHLRKARAMQEMQHLKFLKNLDSLSEIILRKSALLFQRITILVFIASFTLYKIIQCYNHAY